MLTVVSGHTANTNCMIVFTLVTKLMLSLLSGHLVSFNAFDLSDESDTQQSWWKGVVGPLKHLPLPLQVTRVPALLAEEQSQQIPAGTPISIPWPDFLTSSQLPEKLLFSQVAIQGQLQGGQFRWTLGICPQECHQGYHISR